MRSGRDMILTIEALVLTAMMIISAAAGIVTLQMPSVPTVAL